MLDLLWQLGRNDPSRRVRQTALAFLQRLGQVSYEEGDGIPGNGRRPASRWPLNIYRGRMRGTFLTLAIGIVET